MSRISIGLVVALACAATGVPTLAMGPVTTLRHTDAVPIEAAPAAYTAGAGADASSPEAETNLQQAEASIEQVEKDLSRMSTFAAEVKRTVDQEEHAKADVTHALGYFRRQMELHAGERDVAAAHISRVEAEVVSLQRRVKDLEAQAKECEAQKSALAEAKTTVLAQLAKLSEGVGRITAGEAPQW